ncbi:hypothetical protein EH165_02700 [Nakamurella antarctica]|uniref:HdeD family acid-resistance protein n=1 Tax=Nakamurella antarctica TaxID=1902245 RepID=A0A3G8ZIP1_9ACTN|nr:DUF308 domain-containing protein [Nakamurella antarctica]AZI57229.1 hypothetical protein EH165_02700 [Nakamurella antarctica]
MTSFPVNTGRVWWMFALRGALMALFGVLAIILPGSSLQAVVTIFGVYAIVDGAVAVGFGYRNRTSMSRGTGWFGQGVVLAAFGLFAVIWPASVVAAILVIFGIFTALAGVSAIGFALRSRSVGAPHWIFLAALGVLAVVAGLVMVFAPLSSAVGFMRFFGFFALAGGMMLVGGGFRLRRFAARPE